MRSQYYKLSSRVICHVRIAQSQDGVLHLADNWSCSWTRWIYIVVSLKTKFKRHLPGEFHGCSWVFRAWQCSRKGARRAEERRRKKKMKHDFHRFLVRHFSNILEPSYGYCEDGARPESRSKCLWAYKINHRGKYQRLSANTCIVAAILFFRSSLHRPALPCRSNKHCLYYCLN